MTQTCPPRIILRVAVPIRLHRLFDYLAPENSTINDFKPGVRVRVPFGKTSKVGFLVECVEHSDIDSHKLKAIDAIIDSESLLSEQDIRLLHWVSRYYHHPLGDVYTTALPALLRQGKSATLPVEERYALTEQGKAISTEQLTRAPKQKVLLEKFQSHAIALSASQLTIWDEKWRAALKPLLEKALVQVAELDCAVAVVEPLMRNIALVSNPQQQAAIDAVCASFSTFNVFLLEGVTGSGKTEVYMQIIHAALQQQKQVLVLVPEITLTPQLEARFRQRFSVPIAISHSKLADSQRNLAWLKMQQGVCSIMLGTRSALFTPLKNPGLIILDEEHDTSFKQQEGCRFSARDIAVVRAKMLNIPVLMGSATPALESLHNVDKGRYQLLHLPQRAGNAVPPTFQLIDIRNKRMQEGLSATLIAEIKNTLAKKEQVLLFLNRRGFAPTLICHGCGWVMRCAHCDANMVIHAQEKLLRCHHCGVEQGLIKSCLACKTGQLMPLGLGTERVENTLMSLFADKTIVRLDRDSTKLKGSLERYLAQINQGEADIILGTQMLAKGHHFSQVTLVAMLDVDSGLFSVDFHAAEKLAQLIVQVSGRAGRETKPGKVILQTRQPEHPLLMTLIDCGYKAFAKMALTERKEALLPPFSYHALLRVHAADADLAKQFLNTVIKLANEIHSREARQYADILGPVPASMARRAGMYRFQMLFQSQKRPDLHALLDRLLPEINKINRSQRLFWSLDIDPVDLF
ncbi:primosomal protein N' [Crenothrix sp.]|uniref:primosomal protein N' n=1 Tax=Crenothrix sp. TaxID=3100433 RepID=UPI00374DBEAE